MNEELIRNRIQELKDEGMRLMSVCIYVVKVDILCSLDVANRIAREIFGFQPLQRAIKPSILAECN